MNFFSCFSSFFFFFAPWHSRLIRSFNFSYIPFCSLFFSYLYYFTLCFYFTYTHICIHTFSKFLWVRQRKDLIRKFYLQKIPLWSWWKQRKKWLWARSYGRLSSIIQLSNFRSRRKNLKITYSSSFQKRLPNKPT